MKKTKIVLLMLLLALLNITNTSVKAETRQVIYFKEATCLVCAELQGYPGGYSNPYQEDLDYILKLENQGITVFTYDIIDFETTIDEYSYYDNDEYIEVKAADVFFAFRSAYGVNVSDVPMIFVGDSYFYGLKDIKGAIDSNAVYDLSSDPLLDVSVESGAAFKDLTGFVGFLIILGAGLLDGFNPCAIALLLMFISLLGFTKDKKLLILVSVTYIFALYVSYYILGLGLLSALKQSQGAYIAKTIINWVVLLLAFFLFTFNLYDYVMAKRGDYGKIKVQLPKWIKRYNNKILAVFTNAINSNSTKSLIPVLLITFLLGITLSITELICTGGIYGAILAGINDIETGYAYVLLAFYNLMFVFPLIVISVIAVRSASVVSIGNWVREHMTVIKLLNALLFLLVFGYFFVRIFYPELLSEIFYE